ncbi:MAG: Rpn family recombination-promoting nuclease/putative transposase [Treponema sp.]|jgi:predicted transposase/invertase (TIGR01784 family)|nr:Rpn family recombination-promoting nuclease/putative transposase [Treponema sp.]
MIRFDETDDLIDICLDNVFKAVFTRNTPASQGALSRLISALIGRDISVIAISANEPPIDNLRDRQIRFDIACRAENGELVNVEMSLNPDPFEPVRLEFHAGKLFTGQDIRGTDKSYDDLKYAYQIAILAKERFFTDETAFHTFEYYDPVRRVSLNGRSRITTVELSKLERVVEKPIGEMNAQEQWAIFFRYLLDKGKRGKINELIAYEEGIAMASEVLLSISKDEVERARLMSEYKYAVDTQSKIVHAKREGRKEGRKEEKLEIAKAMKDMGDPIEKIVHLTGLTPEEIVAL